MASEAEACSSELTTDKNSDIEETKETKTNCQLIQREHFIWPGVHVDGCTGCSDIPGPPVIPGQSPNCSLRRTYEQCTQNHV